MHGNSRKEDRGAVLILPIDLTTSDTVLVMDTYKPEPLYNKIVGGGIDDPEDIDPEHPLDDMRAAIKAARRELEEETGLLVELDQIEFVTRINKKAHSNKTHFQKTHTQYVFTALADFQHLKAYGRDGEKTLRIQPDEICDGAGGLRLRNFHPDHVNVLAMILEKIRAPMVSQA